MKILNLVRFHFGARFEYQTAPGTPDAGGVTVYAKTDGNLYMKRPDGSEVLVSGNAGGGTVGEIKAWPTATAPAGHLICNGGAFSSATYPALFAVLGTTTLPDFRGRFLVGVGTPSGAAGATAKTLGQRGGEETHVLTTAELPAHTHASSGPGWNESAAVKTDLNFGSGSWGSDQPTGGVTGAHGAAHNNLPPFAAINYIIRAE